MPYSIHTSADAPWEAMIFNIETLVRVGIHAHEAEPQKLLVSAMIRGHYPAYPSDISECMNYDVLHRLVTEIWPKRPQTLLLETLVMECFDEIYSQLKAAEEVTMSISKPDIFASTEKVGVRLTLRRADFLRLKQQNL